MKTLVLGGVKSGKSRHAEKLAKASGKEITVIATAIAGDEEMRERIARHQADRPAHWKVVEAPLTLTNALQSINAKAQVENSHIVIDCLTLWITQLLCSDYSEPQMQQEIDSFVMAVRHFKGELTIVSNETNMGVMPVDALSRRYGDTIGILHQQLARDVGTVVLMVAGLPVTVREP